MTKLIVDKLKTHGLKCHHKLNFGRGTGTIQLPNNVTAIPQNSDSPYVLSTINMSGGSGIVKILSYNNNNIAFTSATSADILVYNNAIKADSIILLGLMDVKNSSGIMQAIYLTLNVRSIQDGMFRIRISNLYSQTLNFTEINIAYLIC